MDSAIIQLEIHRNITLTGNSIRRIDEWETLFEYYQKRLKKAIVQQEWDKLLNITYLGHRNHATHIDIKVAYPQPKITKMYLTFKFYRMNDIKQFNDSLSLIQ